MVIDWNLILRLFVAGLMGGIVGLERTLRAKEAGIRTHFVVALGSALFMIISLFAFGNEQHDAARVAAQVVSGIGFLGAGVIIFQKNAIRGITTAAGLWVVAAIGLAVGAGMYAVGGAAAVITVLFLEIMHIIQPKMAEKMAEVSVDCASTEALTSLMDVFKKHNMAVEAWSLQDGKANFRLRIRQKDFQDTLPQLLSGQTGVTVALVA